MTERERLVELIRNSTQHCLKCGCDFFDDACKYKSEEQCEEKRIADHLLAHGVVCLGFPISHKERNKLKHIALTDRKLKEKWEKG